MGTENGSPSSVGKLYPIVDTDAHITERIQDLLPYIEDRFSGVRKTIEEAEDPLRAIFSVTHPLPGFPHGEMSNDSLYGDDAPVSNIDEKLEEMEDFGLDYSIITPTLTLTLNTINNPQFAVALASAYNRWIADNFLGEHAKLKSTILVAPQKPDIAAEEIERWSDADGIVGVMMPTTGLLPPAGHRRYDPIYEAAMENDLPILFHSASGAGQAAFPQMRKWNQTYVEDHVLVHPFSLQRQFTTLIMRGVPDRFPDLTFVMQESGVSWIPYMTWRLDDHYLMASHELPEVSRMPSECIDDQFYFTTQPLGHTEQNREHLALAVEMAGPENIMFSSDLPHADFDLPEELFDRIESHFDSQTVRGIMGETAAEVFSIDVDT